MRRTHALILPAVLLLLLLPAGSAAAYHFYDDHTAPTTRINTAEGAILSEPTGMTISGTSTDEGGSGVYAVLVTLCSARNATDCSSALDQVSGCYSTCPASHEWRIPLSDVESGGYTLTARAMDAAENEEQTGASIRVMVDRYAPATEIATPDGSVAIPAQGTVQGKSTDDASGVSKVVVEFCTAGTSTGCKTSEAVADCSAGCPVAYRWAAPVPGDLVPGDYQATAHAFDLAGYEEDGGPSISVKVDGSPPVTNITTADGSFLVATQDKIEGTSADDASGVAKALVDFCWNGDPENCKTVEAAADCPSGCPLSYDWAVLLPADLIPGPYLVRARALDRVGNQEKDPPFVHVLVF